MLPGIVAGVGGYGNCLGLPNIGGEVVFDPTYLGNPLVNALCIGAMRHEDIHLASAKGVGNLVVLYGARTGGDGIGGVSVLASETFDEGGPTKRPSVQVGDPFMEKLLIEATLEVLHAGLVEGIQDLGGAGISCATSELASNGEGGMHVWLDRVLLRDPTLSPEEILMSESQERMCAIVTPANLDAFLALCAKWEVEAVVIGEVTDSGRLTVDWHGERIVDVPPRTVAHEGPVYDRPFHRPVWQDALQADGPEGLARPQTADELRATLLTMVAAPNLAVQVLGHVAVRPVRAGQHRARAAGGRGHDPHRRGDRPWRRALDGLQRPLREARPVQRREARARRELPQRRGVRAPCRWRSTNCLNFGSPEDPEVMWQFAQATTGLADGCLELGIPVTGGNVSFYNQTGDTAILPTPVVGVLGVIDDVERRTPIGWQLDGELIYLLGDTHDEFAGSEWAHHVHGHLGGLPPVVDLQRERLLGEILVAGSRDGMLSAAHDVSDGGVGQVLVEMALRSGIGARCWVPDAHRPVHLPVQRVHRPSGRRRGAHRGAPLHGDVRRPRPAGPSHRRRRLRARRGRRAGGGHAGAAAVRPVHRDARRAAGGARAHVAGRPAGLAAVPALPPEVAVALADYAADRVPERAVEKAAVKGSLAVLVERAPGRSVEVRIPPYAAVQVIAGTTHRRGTPSAVVEMDARTWLELAAGLRSWADAVAAGSVRASGARSDLGAWFPLAGTDE